MKPDGAYCDDDVLDLASETTAEEQTVSDEYESFISGMEAHDEYCDDAVPDSASDSDTDAPAYDEDVSSLGTTTSSGMTRGGPDDDEDWVVTPLLGKNKWVLLEHRHSDRTYEVSKYQLQKAKKRLTEESCWQALTKTSCSCKTRKCYQAFTINDLLRLRESISTLPSEADVSTKLMQYIAAGRMQTGGNASPLGPSNESDLRLRLGQRRVCRRFFCAAHGVSDRKLRGKTCAALQSPNPLMTRIDRNTHLPP